MNVGRFHAAIHAIRQESEKEAVIKHLSSLQSALQQSISTPNEQTAQAFKDQYSELRNVLQNAKCNSTFPTRRKIYKEINADENMGVGLLARIDDVIGVNLITPANALAKVQKITKEVDQYYKNLDTLTTLFTELKIEFDDLDPGEFEIGFSLPRNLIEPTVESFEKEFDKLDNALRALQEISGGGGGSPTITAISASEWQIFIDTLPETAACTAIAIERIVTIYKNNLEIKLIKKQLEEKELPNEVTKPLQDHVEKAVKAEIRKVAEELVDEFYKGDEARKNELKNKTSQALRYIADRMDRGATIEVHAEPPEEPKLGEKNEGGESVVEPIQMQRYQELKKLAESVNERMMLVSSLQRTNEPTLFLDYDAEQGDSGGKQSKQKQ